MKGFLYKIWKQYKFNNILFKNLSIIIGAVLLLMIVFSSVIFAFNKRMSENELKMMQKNSMDVFVNSVDQIFQEVTFIVEYLATDDLVKIYTYNDRPKDIIGDYDVSMRNKIIEIPTIYDYIDSVYIYSANTERVFSSAGEFAAKEFRDSEWLEAYANSSEMTTVYFRKMYNRFPYVMTVVKRLDTYESKGAVVVNVNMAKIGKTIDPGGKKSLEKYIIDADNNIIYENSMSMFLEKFDTSLIGGVEEDVAAITGTGRNTTIVLHKMSNVFNLRYIEINRLDSFSLSQRKLFLVLLLIALAAIILIMAVVIQLNVKIYEPLYQLSVIDDFSASDKRSMWRSSAETSKIAEKIISVLDMSNDLKTDLFKQFEKAERFKNYSLQLQINSHFIFNTLNHISLSLAKDFGKDNYAVKLLADMSKFIRYTLNTDESFVTVSTEIECAKIYLTLMQARNDEGFNIDWNIDERLLGMKIPKLCLQPVIENAVFHGLMPSEKERQTLKISITETDGTALIEITDNGEGMSEESLASLIDSLYEDELFGSKHIGLKNVHQRIKIYFGEEWGVSVESKSGVGTRVILRFPKKA